MATIQVDVEVLDEKCAYCKILRIHEEALYKDGSEYVISRCCERLDVCRIIENQRRKEE